jgi:DNA-binding NarL/FixJ family response regulator
VAIVADRAAEAPAGLPCTGGDLMKNRERLIRVVVANQHPIFSIGLEGVVAWCSDIEVVAAVNNGRDALHAIAIYRPTVALLDATLPQLSGIELVRIMRARYPDVAVLMLTCCDEVGNLRSLLTPGIHGYLSRSSSGDQLISAIRLAADRDDPKPSDPMEGAADDEAAGLTQRELDVLQHIAQGRRNAEIAELLDLSVKTVEYHVSHCLEKLGARTRTEAARNARQLGLVVRDHAGAADIVSPSYWRVECNK